MFFVWRMLTDNARDFRASSARKTLQLLSTFSFCMCSAVLEHPDLWTLCQRTFKRCLVVCASTSVDYSVWFVTGVVFLQRCHI